MSIAERERVMTSGCPLHETGARVGVISIEICTSSAIKKMQKKGTFFTAKRVTRVSHLGCKKHENSWKNYIKITTLKPEKGL